jgi:hypothetical protein
MPSPVLVNIWQSPPNHSRLQPPPDFFEDREKEEADADKTPLTRDEPVTSSTSADGGSDLPSPEGRAGDPPVLTGEVPADEHWNGFSRKGLRGPELSPGSIVSETVGRELSRIVDAVVPEERGEQPSGKTIEGRMTYRIVPSPSPGEEGAGGSGSAMSTGVEIEVDFDAISSRYRQLVMSYFSRISGDFLHERNGDDRNRKGTPGSGS